MTARRPRAAALAVALLAGSGCGPERGTIGALLAQNGERRLVVKETPPGLAAEREGIRAGDEVLLIDGRDVRGMTAEQVHRALSGDVGEPVKLTLVRDGQVLRVTLRRTEAKRRNPRPEAPPGAAAP